MEIINTFLWPDPTIKYNISNEKYASRKVEKRKNFLKKGWGRGGGGGGKPIPAGQSSNPSLVMTSTYSSPTLLYPFGEKCRPSACHIDMF